MRVSTKISLLTELGKCAHDFSHACTHQTKSTSCRQPVDMFAIIKKFRILLALLFLGMYLVAFLVVHTSSTLRKPAANMAYWYYSDNPVIENIEFYGFWPLRQIGYHVPGFQARHYLERINHYDPNPPM